MSDARLRPIESDDVTPLAALLASPQLVGRRGLMGDDRPIERSVAAIRKLIEPLVEPEHGEAWTVEAGGVVGVATVGFWWDVLSPRAHIVIDPDHHRKGYGTAAAWLIFEHVFTVTPAILVQYGVPDWDAAGLSFAESLGSDRVGKSRRVGIREGRYFDRWEFVMERMTWEASLAARR